MDKHSLQQILETAGIRPCAYDLDGGHPSECYVLAKEGSLWSVYYSERGQESNKRQFSTEDIACEYLLKILREDSSVWQ